MSATIACVVEGHGDVAAVPVLLRRLAEEEERYDIMFPRPVRCPKTKFIRGVDIEYEELERAIAFATKKLPSADEGAVLILIDADEACPADVGPRILGVAQKIRPDVQFGVVLAKQEFEAWFAASIESLKAQGRFPEDAQSHPSPEDLSDAKGYLRTQLGPGGFYSETVDQPSFAALFDLTEAESCRSFRKLRDDVRNLLSHLSLG